VTEPQDLRRRVQEFAEDLAAKPAAALAAIRRTVTLGGGMSFEDGMAFELETATALADTADFAEGVGVSEQTGSAVGSELGIRNAAMSRMAEFANIQSRLVEATGVG
jgi:hypothetical protein